MYLEHFSLKEAPFSLTPDTSFFMSRAGYQDALNVLLVALRSGEGFVKVTGEVGTGKTLLCRTLLKSLGEEFATAYVPNPYLTPKGLLQALAEELDIECRSGAGSYTLLQRIHESLIARHEDGRRSLVCMDEVQAMPVQTLETLRLLTNLETEKSKLLQVVLFGQPELDQVLDQPSVRQLRQRITFSYELLPLNRVALAPYLRHRMAVAGYDGPPLFSRPAMDLIYRASRGIPRLVNILAHKSMMAAFGTGEHRIRRAHVARAVEDTADARNWASSRPRGGWRRALRWVYGSLGAVAVLALAIGLGFGIGDVAALIR